MNNPLKEMEETMRRARAYGALYHPTHPSNAWFCECGVFGKGDDETCWACDTPIEHWKWMPRFGGGAQRTSEDLT